jgi:hypothetical protein
MPSSEIVCLAVAEFGEFVYVCVCMTTDDNTVSVSVSYTRDSTKIIIMITFNSRCETALSQTVPDKSDSNVHSAFRAIKLL